MPKIVNIENEKYLTNLKYFLYDDKIQNCKI